MTFKIEDTNRIIMSREKTFAITWMDNVELTDYKSMSWDDFLNILELQTMRKNPSYSFEYLKKAQKIFECLHYDIKDSTVHYYEPPTDNDRLPLVIEIENLALLMSPKVKVK